MNPSMKRHGRLVLVSVGLLLFNLLLPVHAQGAKNGKPAPEIYAGIIVKYKSTSAAKATATSATTMHTVEERARVKIAASRRGALDVTVYRFDKAMPAAEARAAAARLALDPDVEYAVPDQVMHALQTTPNDTEYAGKQWTLQAPPAVVGGANLPLAWQRTTGSNTVVVAVIDNGIRPGHPDLAGRLLAGYDFISSDAYAALNYPANWNAADGNGRDADPTDPGDFLDDALLAQLPPNHGLQVRPSSWHGTHVAGAIGAASNNAVGISGVDWSARILPVRVLGRNGGASSDIIDGIAWAAGLAVPGVPANANPARIINISLGGSGVCSAAYQDVVNRVRAVGAIVVAPAGNDGALVVSQPANCEGVIAVTAHSRDGDNASYSSVGTQVAISAPGGGCGALALIDIDGAQTTFNQTCAGCHSIDSLRQQITQRAPAGLTFTKARAALNSALMGVDLDGTDTGDMAALAVGLNNTARNDLAGVISQIACSGPTDRVLSTLNLGTTTPADEGYGTKVGTSNAASHVSGTIALLLSLAPRLTADEVKSVLQTTARPHPKDTYCAMGGNGCGSGLLDANAAVQHVVTNRPTVTATLQPAAAGVRPGATFTLAGDVKAAGGRMPGTTGMSWRQTSGPTVTIPAGSGASVTLAAPTTTGVLTFEYAATDSAGYAGTASVAVTVNAAPTMSPTTGGSVTANQPISGSVRGSDPDSDAITYVLVEGPPGLTLNASTGAWSWTPTSAGTFGVTVMPTDAYGTGTPVNFTISVAKDPNAKDGGGGALPWWIALLLLAPTGRHFSRTRVSPRA
jgi:serine protease